MRFTRHHTLILISRSVFIIMAFFAICAGCGTIHAQGLRFSGIPEATSLDLSPGTKIRFNGTVTIEFDIIIYEPKQFGQILVIDKETEPISMTYITRYNGTPTFVVNSLTDKSKFIEIPCEGDKLEEKAWRHVVITLSPSDNHAAISVGQDKGHILKGVCPKATQGLGIVFGSNKASVIDTPTMAIKDVMIHDSNKDFRFRLNESDGDAAHESHGKYKGRVVNPHWLANDHFKWKEIARTTADPAAGIAYDEHQGRLIIVGGDSLKFLYPKAGDVNSIPITGGRIPAGYSGEAVLNQEKDVIYYYNLMNEDNKARPFFATIGLDGKLLDLRHPDFSSPLHHHAYTWFGKGQELFIFGGYGNYEYSSRIYRYDFTGHQWNDMDYSGDSISPRMHTVSGKLSDDEMLIFGGVGNKVGRQELGKEFYFDLYSYCLSTNKMEKLWQVYEDELYVPTRGIIVDKDDDVFYVFCKNRTQNSYLKRFNLKTGESAVVSSSLCIPTNSILSSYYLFLDEREKKMYAVNRQSDNDDSSIVTMFSLDYPPICKNEITSTEGGNERCRTLIWFFLIAVGLLACGGVIYRRKHQCDNAMDVSESEVTKNESRRNSILFFGGFMVIDRNGDNITNRFGSKLKQVLTCIMLYSENYGGISTSRLTTMIWPEKILAEAKNIRGVTINHLRKILSDVNGIELKFDEGKWHVTIDNRLYWDYQKAKELSNTLIKNNDEYSRMELLRILSTGPLLPNFVKYDWFDKIKIESEELFYQVIENNIPLLYDKGEYKETIQLCEAMFNIDRFNETAIQYKVESLKRIGKIDLAKNAQARFNDEVSDFS